MSGVLAVVGLSGAPGIINGALGGSEEASPAFFIIDNDGSYDQTAGSLGAWVTPANATVAAHYQVKVDATSGTFSSGTTGTWLDCSSDNAWTKSGGSVTFTISFREKASGIVRSTQAGLVLTGT